MRVPQLDTGTVCRDEGVFAQGFRLPSNALSHPHLHPPGRSTWGLKSGGILSPPQPPAFLKAVIQKDPPAAWPSKPGGGR